MRITRNYDEVVELTGGDVLVSPEYFETQHAIDWGYIISDRCILPFYIKKKLFFKYLLFTSDIRNADSQENKIQFLNDALHYIKENLSVDFILNQHVTALFECCPENSIYCSFGSYIVDLTVDEELLFANLHSKHRNVIKKAEKDGVVVKCGMENRESCIALIQSTLKRQHVALLDRAMLERLTNVKNVDYWTAVYQGELHGAAIILWTENQGAYYMFGGSASKPHSGAMNLLQWKIMMALKERGVRYYDFVGARINPEEGSKYEGIQRFKSRFGGELKRGYLWKMPINKVKYKLFCWLIAVKQGRNYKGDVIEQERRRGNF